MITIYPIKSPHSFVVRYSLFVDVVIFSEFLWFIYLTLYPGMGSANEKRHYYVMYSLVGQAHTQNDP